MQQEQGKSGTDSLMRGGLGHLVKAARNAIFATSERELAPLGLTSATFIVVIGVMRHRARTAKDVCAFAGVDALDISGFSDRRAAKGRVRSNADRRQMEVELPDKRRALSPHIMPARVRLPAIPRWIFNQGCCPVAVPSAVFAGERIRCFFTNTFV